MDFSNKDQKTYNFAFLILGLFPILPFIAKPFIIIPFLLIGLFQIFKTKKFNVGLFLLGSIPFLIFLYSFFYSEDKSRAITLLCRLLPLAIFPFCFASMPRLYFEKAKIVFIKTFIISCCAYCLLIFLYIYSLHSIDLNVIYPNISNEFWGFNDHPIYISTYLCISVILLLFEKNKSKYFILPILIFTILFLSRKGSILSLLLIVIIYVLQLHKKKAIFKIIFPFSILALIFIISTFVFPPLAERFSAVFYVSDWKNNTADSTGIRDVLWNTSGLLSSESPFFGYGIGDVQHVLDQRLIEYGFDNLVSPIQKYNTHNEYLQIVLSSGYVGLILFLIYYFALILKIKRKQKGLYIVLYIGICMLFESMFERQNGSLFIALFFNLFLFDSLQKTKNSKINIALIGVNYSPEDSSTGLYSTQMMEYLAKDKKFNISVITAFPYYPQWKIAKEYEDKKYLYKEIINNVEVYRSKQIIRIPITFSSRIFLIFSYTWGATLNMFRIKNKPDIVIPIVPFTSSIFIAWIAKILYGSKIWTHIQDFEFDAAIDSGIVSKNKKGIISGLFLIEKFFFNRSNITSTISNSMMNKLKEKTHSEVYFLPNWIDDDFITETNTKKHHYFSNEKFNILYSGNIGEKQDWNVFVNIAQKLAELNPSIHFVVVGDGGKANWLKNEIQNLSNTSYYPPVPYNELPTLLTSANTHILFQKCNVIESVMPSKLLGMMLSRIPVIVSGNTNSEVKTILNQSNGGYYISDNNETQIIETIQNLYLSKENIVGINANLYIKNNFSKDKILSQFKNKLLDVNQQ